MRFSICFSLLAMVSAVSATEPKAKPNVVVIQVDGLGPRDLGCTGSTYYKTPNLDAFAKRGVKLEEAYAGGGGFDATQFSLLTGTAPARFNLHDSDSLQTDPGLRKLMPPKRVHEIPKSVPTIANELHAAGYVTYHNGPQHQSFARHFFFGTKALGFSDSEVNIPTFNEFLKRHSDKPFFIVWECRGKWTPDAKSLAKYKAGVLGTQGNPTHAVHVEAYDTVIGELLKELDERKLTDDTIVVVTGTGGAATVLETPETPVTSNAPYREGKGYLYEGGLRVPFLIRGPGVKTGGFPIISADVAPTLLGLCGIKSEIEFQGINLAPQFRGDAKADPKREFHWHQPYYTPSLGKPAGAIRAGNYKLIEYFETDRRELFDLSKDIGESRNLAAEKPEVVKEMAAKLAARRKDIGAKMPAPNPDYAPNPQAKDGTITLPARTAFVTGTQLRFEPAPHKNTLGYWTNAADTAYFEFTVTTPGTFAVGVLQGAGKGSGGAEVELAVGDSNFKFTVKDTGGFQAFENREVGELTIVKAGRHTLTVTPKSKPGVAVMDLREVTLTIKK